MNIYNQVPMLTLGNVPTNIVEVPISIPTPFIPNWTKTLLWVLGGVAVVGFVLWFFSERKNTKNAATFDKLKAAHEEQMRLIEAAKRTPWQSVKLS